MIQTPIRTRRMVLRPVTEADRADLMALEADAQVMRYLNGGQPAQAAPVRDYLMPRGNEPEVMAAIDLASGAFLGWFALFDDGVVDDLKTAELGYRLRRSAWGQGYATEGALALVGHAFVRAGFDRVQAETMAVNRGSRRVLEKAGFRLLKTRFPTYSHPIAGDEQGEVVYEIRRAPR
ncbi:MAG TPA: GNAT family N-acetyltransferase [Hydrogenophaga sp.]